MSVSDLSLSDLRREYFGGGSDAEYEVLRAYYDDGLTAADVLGTVDEWNTFKTAADVDWDTLQEIGAGLDGKINNTLLDANSVLIAVADNTPVALAMGASTTLARLAAGDIVAATVAQMKTLYGFVSSAEVLAAVGTDVLASRVVGDANDRFVLNADGKMEWGGAVGATDTNLYRVAADSLKTDDSFVVGTNLSTLGNSLTDGYITAANGGAKVAIGALGPASEAAVLLGSSSDVNIFRSAADVLKTSDEFYSASRIIAKAGNSAAVWIGTDGPASESSISFQDHESGSILYRDAANVLRASGSIRATSDIESQRGTSAQTKMGAVGPGGQSGVLFNNNQDTNLYCPVANTLQTNDNLIVDLDCQVKQAIKVVGVANGNGFIETEEQSADPAAPVANRGRIFMKDNGAGKTQLAVIFNTGAVQIIATQP